MYYVKFKKMKGEISPGDFYWSETLRKVNSYSSLRPELTKPNPEDSRVKLHVYKTEITQSDSARCGTNPNGWVEKPIEIGEVSPDAKWVTEGMRFSENEVKIVKYSESRRAVCPELPERRVKLLGSCGHYH